MSGGSEQLIPTYTASASVFPKSPPNDRSTYLLTSEALIMAIYLLNSFPTSPGPL
jgi:hypothetical protein